MSVGASRGPPCLDPAIGDLAGARPKLQPPDVAGFGRSRPSPPAPDGTPPLFPLPHPSPVLPDDPPVFLVDPADGDSHEARYADRFTTYVLTSVWDASLPAAAVSDFDRP